MSKFVTSATGKQMITTHNFPNIWRSKDDQTVKFGLSEEYDLRFFFKSYAESKFRGIVADLFFEPPAVAGRFL